MQIEERRQINAWAEGVTAFRDQVRANNDAHRYAALSLPLITDHEGIDLDHQGIDELRRRWDGICASIRARIYDRRLEAVDMRAAQLRRRRSSAVDAAEQQNLDDALQSLVLQRADIVQRRRTDTDPALRCTPAVDADICSDSNNDAWCNPQLKRPEEFTEEE
jgi:hypothetical protein